MEPLQVIRAASWLLRWAQERGKKVSRLLVYRLWPVHGTVMQMVPCLEKRSLPYIGKPLSKGQMKKV